MLCTAALRGWEELVGQASTRRRHGARIFALRGGLVQRACWDAWGELIQEGARRKRWERQRARTAQGPWLYGGGSGCSLIAYVVGLLEVGDERFA